MVRLFSSVTSVLFHSSTLQSVENHEFSRSREEVGPAKPLNNKGLVKLHFVIFV